MSVILFYSPFIRRSRDVESLMLRFKADGHRVISLSQLSGDDINPFLRANGIEACSYVVNGNTNLFYYLRHLLYFIAFCRKHKVAIVFSHLDSPNFVASIGQYFVRARVYLCRHHINEAELYNYQQSLTYRITNRLAKKIIVVSRQSLEYMATVEKVARDKLIHIDLAYDFSLYKIPDQPAISVVRNTYVGDLLLLTVCRLTEYKRPDLSIQVVENLKAAGLDAKLIILGTGPMESKLRKYVTEKQLTGSVFLPGHVKNPLDFIAAADFILHPSILESSCVVIKEAGLVSKPVIVCSGIGDFDDYIRNGVNGYMVEADEFVESVVQIIRRDLGKASQRQTMGENLKADVIRRFDINNVISSYRTIVNY